VQKKDERSEFDLERLDDALDAPRWDGEYEKKLLAIRDYVLACVECIYPESVQVVDSNYLLRRFEEAYLAAAALMRDVDAGLAERLKQLEEELRLSQNVVRLGAVSSKEFVEPSFWSRFARVVTYTAVPLAGVTLTLRDDEPQKASAAVLLDVRVALTRLAGLLSTGARRAKEEWLSAQDVLVIEGYYDPRRVAKGFVSIQIKKALDSLAASSSLPLPVQQALKKELTAALNELDHYKVPWNKVLSRLTQVMLVLAALVSAGADIDDAYKNVRAAIEYVSRASTSTPEESHASPRLPLSPAPWDVALPPSPHAHEEDEQEE
jgi:hypothetical protein